MEASAFARLIAWWRSRGNARVRYPNRQDSNLIGGSRVPGETEESITLASYVSSASRLGVRDIVSIGGNQRKVHMDGCDALGWRWLPER